MSNYVLTLETPVGTPYHFDLKQYVIETGGDVRQIPTSSICTTVDQLFDSELPLAEAMKQIEGSVQISIGKVFSISVSSGAEPLVELLYSIRKYATIENSKVIIAIKGYADGQYGEWSDTLLSPPYDYDSISVLPPTNPKSLNPVSYFLKDSVIRVDGGVYNNTLLPDLRAEFVRRELVEPFLQTCGQFDADTRVVKGFMFNRPGQPEQRKVEIFIYLLEK